MPAVFLSFHVDLTPDCGQGEHMSREVVPSQTCAFYTWIDWVSPPKSTVELLPPLFRQHLSDLGEEMAAFASGGDDKGDGHCPYCAAGIL